jgi:alpha-beta hydrolase superfamily lysophospholipase
MPTASKLPIFFQQLEELLDEIPAVGATPSNPLSTVKHYLDFYQLDLINVGLAISHHIQQSQIESFRIVEQVWEPLNYNGKTLIICHGYFDHTGLYGKVIRWALQNHFRCHCFDLPGHGLSSGEPAAIDSFDQYSKVLSHIVKRENYSRLSFLGQSTGCAVILNALLDKQFSLSTQNTIDKVFLLAPLVRSKGWQKLRYIYFALRPVLSSIKRGFAESSHNWAFNDFLKHEDPLQSRRIALCWLGAMEEWTEKIKQPSLQTSSPSQSFSTLIIQGDDDQTVDWEYNLEQIKRCLPDSKIEPVPGGKHQLVNESEEYWNKVEQLLAEFLAA